MAIAAPCGIPPLQMCPRLYCHSSSFSSSLAASTTMALHVPRVHKRRLRLRLVSRFFRAGVATALMAQTQAEEETDENDFVEVGRICSLHGVLGEVRVVPFTDFPDERFRKPGARWLRFQLRNVVNIQQFELLKGREHAGKGQWLLTFKGIDSADKAKDLIGASILVKSKDRPTLLDGEYYSSDLVGTSVFLQETDELVGTVVGVYKTRANDLLRVSLSENRINDISLSSSHSDEEHTIPRIWIPFVKAIVPVVDLQNRSLFITPPEGLLELNLQQKGSLDREKRQEEWKKKRKLSQRVAAVKKKLSSFGQEHILAGLSDGDESQKQALLDQIFSFDFKLLKHALQDSAEAYERFDLCRYIDLSETKNSWFSLKDIAKGQLQSVNVEPANRSLRKLRRKGLELLQQFQIAVILYMDLNNEYNGIQVVDILDDERKLIWHDWFQYHCNRLLSVQNLAVVGHYKKVEIPLIIIIQRELLETVRSIFLNQDFFGLNKDQVWFVTQEHLPCLRRSNDGKEKIIMGSPWEIRHSPAGPGSIVFSLLNQNVLEKLQLMGISYVQICSANCSFPVADPELIAIVHEKTVDVGVKLVIAKAPDPAQEMHTADRESLPYALYLKAKRSSASDLKEVSQIDNQEKLVVQGFHTGSPCFDMIFSMQYLWKLTKKLYKAEFYINENYKSNLTACHKISNDYSLRSSVYSLLKFSSSDKVALLLYH